MSLTTLPTKIDGTDGNAGLGRVKADNLPDGIAITGAELEHYTTAQELENIKTAVVQVAADVGIDGAPASGSIKDRLDTLEQERGAKLSARVATTAAITLASQCEAGDTIDGVVLVAGDRVLVKDQAAPAENGIYVVAASGAPSRATDFDASADVTEGAFLFVREGTANADTGWQLTTNAPITIGATSLAFSQFTVSPSAVMASIDWAEAGDLAAVGTASAAGTSAEVPRADHVHAHGAQTDASLHAVAAYQAAGFMSAEAFDRAHSRRLFAPAPPEDFISNTTVLAGTRFLSSASGAGAGVSLLDNVAGHPGCVTMTSGTTTAGKIAIYTGGGSIFRLGTDALDAEYLFQVPTLSVLNEDFQVAAGWSDTVATAEPTAHGIMLVYDRLNRGDNKLYAITAASASGGPPLTTNITRTDTGVTLVANDWVRAIIKINAARTSVEFWVGINGATPTLVATNTTNIPTATVLWASEIVVLKQSGTTARTVILDYIDPFYYRLTSAR